MPGASNSALAPPHAAEPSLPGRFVGVREPSMDPHVFQAPFSCRRLVSGEQERGEHPSWIMAPQEEEERWNRSQQQLASV